MQAIQENYEFSGARSRSYKKALSEFPDVWGEDMLVMQTHLNPQPGEQVLEIGAGSGFFSFEISKLIGEQGHLWITDPSPEQLRPIIDNQPSNVDVLPFPAEMLEFEKPNVFDAIWSRGAFHHSMNKVEAFKRLHNYAKPGARMVIFDIFANTKLADYFDEHVALTCTTGHEVSFLSKGFARSLCLTTGWSEPEFIDIQLQWHFDNKTAIGEFLSLLHSNKPEYSAEDSLKDAERLLGVKRVADGYHLHWPMTLMVTRCNKD